MYTCTCTCMHTCMYTCTCRGDRCPAKFVPNRLHNMRPVVLPSLMIWRTDEDNIHDVCCVVWFDAFKHICD